MQQNELHTVCHLLFGTRDFAVLILFFHNGLILKRFLFLPAGPIIRGFFL
jgi:hypothetical protein